MKGTFGAGAFFFFFFVDFFFDELLLGDAYDDDDLDAASFFLPPLPPPLPEFLRPELLLLPPPLDAFRFKEDAVPAGDVDDGRRDAAVLLLLLPPPPPPPLEWEEEEEEVRFTCRIGSKSSSGPVGTEVAAEMRAFLLARPPLPLPPLPPLLPRDDVMAADAALAAAAATATAFEDPVIMKDGRARFCTAIGADASAAARAAAAFFAAAASAANLVAAIQRIWSTQLLFIVQHKLRRERGGNSDGVPGLPPCCLVWRRGGLGGTLHGPHHHDSSS